PRPRNHLRQHTVEHGLRHGLPGPIRPGLLRHHPRSRVDSGRSGHPAVTFGTRDNYRTEYINFVVTEFETSYHTIMGRPSLAKFMVIPNHTYLLLKMPAPKGVLSVYGDLQTSYACEAKNIELSDTLE